MPIAPDAGSPCRAASSLTLYALPKNPMRPPEWRWNYALARAGSTDESRARYPDGWARNATAFVRTLNGSATKPRKTELDPLRVAMDVFQGDALNRAEVEARILAIQPRAEIAQAYGISEPAVEAYAALFFDIESRRDCLGWLIRFTVSHESPLCSSGWTVPALWKYLGLIGGPVVLDALIAAAPRSELLKHGVEAYHRRSVKAPLTVQSLVATTCVQPNLKSVRRMLRLDAQLKRIASVQRRPDVGLDPSLAVNTALKASLHSIVHVFASRIAATEAAAQDAAAAAQDAAEAAARDAA